MSVNEKINFRQSRDFGEVFNVSVKFTKQNFKHFFSSLIAIAGPFVLLSSIAGAFYQSSSLGIMSLSKIGGEDFLAQYGISAGIFILTSIISNLTLIGTTNAFLINYHENGPNNFSISDVSKTLLKNTGKIVRTFFAFLLVLTLLVLVFVGIGLLIAFTKAVALMVLAFLALIIVLIILMPPLFWQLSITYLIAMYEQKGGFASLNRSIKLMKGNFWWTWVIMICATMAVGILSFVFALPQTIYQFVLMFSHLKPDGTEAETSIPFIVVATVCTFCSTLIYSILYIIGAFHYFSLAEQKEGLGLLDKIDEIGNPTQSNEEQYY
jgi:hypothetical protein